jgi:hypothetical protein
MVEGERPGDGDDVTDHRVQVAQQLNGGDA